jgi:hypothetical protein
MMKILLGITALWLLLVSAFIAGVYAQPTPAVIGPGDWFNQIADPDIILEVDHVDGDAIYPVGGLAIVYRAEIKEVRRR